MKLLLGPHRYRRRVHVVCELNGNVMVWSRKQKCLEALSEDRKLWRSCDVSRQVVPYCSARSCECATADCRSTGDRYVQPIKAGRTQSSSWRHVCDASEVGRPMPYITPEYSNIYTVFILCVSEYVFKTLVDIIHLQLVVISPPDWRLLYWV